MAINPFALEYPVNPEAVEPSFLDDNYLKAFSGPRLSFLLKLSKALQQRSNRPPHTKCFDIFIAAAPRQEHN